MSEPTPPTLKRYEHLVQSFCMDCNAWLCTTGQGARYSGVIECSKCGAANAFKDTTKPVNLLPVKQATARNMDIAEESVLAMAQATIQNAINAANISVAEFARRMARNRTFVCRILGGHNLTIKTMARALAACGQEVRFETVPIGSWTKEQLDDPETWRGIGDCGTREEALRREKRQQP